jgi:hypothetical protein
VIEDEQRPRDLAVLAVPSTGSLQDTGDPWTPFRVIDPAGTAVYSMSVYFRDLQAVGRSVATICSSGMDLLRWFGPVGDRGAVEPGDKGQGPRLLALDAGGRQAVSPALAATRRVG